MWQVALKTSVCLCVIVTPVLMTVCGDDMVGCVLQLVAHEAPGGDAQLWVSFHVNI